MVQLLPARGVVGHLPLPGSVRLAPGCPVAAQTPPPDHLEATAAPLLVRRTRLAAHRKRDRAVLPPASADHPLPLASGQHPDTMDEPGSGAGRCVVRREP